MVWTHRRGADKAKHFRYHREHASRVADRNQRLGGSRNRGDGQRVIMPSRDGRSGSRKERTQAGELMATSTTQKLENGSRVGIVGGGPSGSFFAYFLTEMARVAGLRLEIELFEPRDFSRVGPHGCNMCGGIVSESLVQNLAAEGINLPPSVVRRGIDSYVLHLEAGHVRIETPRQEMRIAAVHRGAGPRDMKGEPRRSLDGHLLDLAIQRGTRRRTERVVDFMHDTGRPAVVLESGEQTTYDLLAVAVGVNWSALKLLRESGFGYSPPRVTKTQIREYYLGKETIDRYLGSSMHVFLLNLPRLEFAAIIPKEDYATVCLLGEDIDKTLTDAFMSSPAVRSCFPPNWDPDLRSCQCGPWISTHGAAQSFADRVVFLGDCGATRLYKDGIGAAYRAAKSAAQAAVFRGISAEDLRATYGAYCRGVETDNSFGRVTFAFTRLIQRVPMAHAAIRRAAAAEQRQDVRDRRLSMILWDLFTGSQSYRRVFLRTLHPLFLWGIARGLLGALGERSRGRGVDRSGQGMSGVGEESREKEMKASHSLGRPYQDGEIVVRQGETGDALFVIQEGKARVTIERDGKEILLRELGPGDIIGEMALFDREVRSATVRALGPARILTVDRDGLLRRIQEDPSLAFHIMRTMAHRVRQLTSEVSRLKAEERSTESLS